MTNSFGATSTTDEVLRGIDLSGKRVLVTGVSAGIGVESARALAAHGAEVIGAARNLSKAQGATEQESEVQAGEQQSELQKYYGKVAAFSGTIGGISSFLGGLSKAGMQTASILPQ